MAIINACFSSGAATFLTNAVILALFPPLGLLTAILAPGFIFGLVLLDGKQAVSSAKKLSFLLLSGGLFIAAAFLVTAHSYSWQNEPFTFSLASVGGAVGLLVAYKFLLDNAISLNRGIPLVVGIGRLSAVIPTCVLFSNSVLPRVIVTVCFSGVYLI